MLAEVREPKLEFGAVAYLILRSAPWYMDHLYTSQVDFMDRGFGFVGAIASGALD
jgi:hypothetical protein